MKTKQSAVKVMPPQQDDESIADLMQKLLVKIGEDPERPGIGPHAGARRQSACAF